MVNVFSFCLYGSVNPLYYTGLLENIYLIGRFFPEWKVYVYLGSDVTTDMRELLVSVPFVVVRDTHITNAENMIHRFFAIDEEEVELMIVRDADSRIHWKDRWAIQQFVLQPNYTGHIIRDNNQHRVAMMGGLWGIRKRANICIRHEYEQFCIHPRDHGAGVDQSFLAERIYPKILNTALVHCSYGIWFPGETHIEFPFAWTPDVFCGKPESPCYIDRPEPQQELRIQREGPIHTSPFKVRLIR